MRAVFLGTPTFAVPSLQALASRHSVAGVFTQPDRPKGRGNDLAESPVKQAARELGFTVYQPERIRRPENLDLLRSLAADIMVVVGYGQIIPQSIIDLPRHGILNVHASLLPKYRGAAPIQWAIANGEATTGVTIMRIDAGLDTGNMLSKAEADIGADETAPELGGRLAELGAELLLQAMAAMEAGHDRAEAQDNDAATLAPILKKEDGLVDWRRTAKEIYNRFRGFNPWPGAYTLFRGRQLSLTGMSPTASSLPLEPGGTAWIDKKWLVSCGGNTTLELLEVQLAGKKKMSAAAFLNGYPLHAGEKLGATI